MTAADEFYVPQPSVVRRATRGARLALVYMAPGRVELVRRDVNAANPDSIPALEIPQHFITYETPELDLALSDSIIEKAEVILMVPPADHFHWRMPWPSRTMRTISSRLSHNTKLAFITPRENLAEITFPVLSVFSIEFMGWFLSVLIELPGDKLFEELRSQSRVCVVILEAKEPDRVISLSVRDDTPVDSAFDEFDSLLACGGQTDHGIAIDEELDWAIGPALNELDPDEHKRIARRIDETSMIGELRPLSGLCEILLGSSGMSTRIEPRDDDISVLSSDMILRGGLNTTHGVDPLTVARDAPELRAGDLVFPSIFRGTLIRSRSPIRVAEISEEDLPMVAGEGVIIIRPHDHLDAAERLGLYYFLQSRRFCEQVSHSWASRAWRLTPEHLEDIKVPVPDRDYLTAVETVHDVAGEFQRWRDEATACLESSLDSDELVKARQQLIESSNLLRQRADAARMLDDLGHRVATRFPLPVAYRWRGALAARGGTDALPAILKAQEVLLAYLAIMALTVARATGQEMGHIRDIRHRFNKRRGGVTLGDWRAILMEAATAELFRGLLSSQPLVEVREFFRSTDVVEASNRLFDRRNDISHMREFGPSELSGALDAAWFDLETLFAAAEFMTEYPLVHVVETRWDSLESNNSVIYRSLVGDSPIVPRLQVSVDSSDIEAGSLYLMDARRDFHLLRPLIVGMECPRCGHWSTFHPDRVKRDGVVMYKSLEHGHPSPMPRSEGDALSAIGLLDNTKN